MIYHLVGREILNKTVYFACHFNVYFLRKWRKFSQNSKKTKISKCKFTRQMIYHIVGHKILNKTLYSFKRYYFHILRYLRKCMKKFNIIEGFKILLHKLRHEYAKRIYKTAMPYIMIDVI